MRGGRPLLFLTVVLGGWIGMRVALLWPASAPGPLAVLAPGARASGRALPPRVEAATNVAPPAMPRPEPAGRARQRGHAAGGPGPASGVPAPPVTFALAPSPPRAAGIPPMRIAVLPGLPPAPSAYLPPRLSGSGWMIVRGGAAIPFAPQLGGDQAGMRLTYAVDGARRLAIVGRYAAALGMPQQVAAFGLGWRPTSLPVHLVAEQRFGLRGVRGGPALGLVGGVGPLPLAGGVRIDAYGQGGAIARDGIEGFIDGAVRLSQPVAAWGPARIELGLAAWGGAQRGAARLDAGPAAAFALPLAARTLRVSVEWRQRLMGNAAPASGPAMAIGTDF